MVDRMVDELADLMAARWDVTTAGRTVACSADSSVDSTAALTAVPTAAAKVYLMAGHLAVLRVALSAVA